MKVLFVEDSPRLGEATCKALARSGLAVDWFRDAEDGWHAWRSSQYDAAILDIMLAPEAGLEPQDGLDLLLRVRAAGISTPVILLTALGSVDERVRGLETGADDYLVKPFAIEELVARLRALARRPLALAEDVVCLGNLGFDRASNELVVGDRRTSLSRGESIVIERFLRAPNRVITKTQLGDSIHSLEEDYTENSIHVHIHRVRAKLAELDADVAIRTLRGLGYMAITNSRASAKSG
ncbi:response regulator transcription factor [Alteraurantiacibacter aquimixticola]|uniref:Response regulator transcription factor n=1 Tax=Alteraurantiacibacter aquimixticola TaxID=2489173 RepID=A0A4V6UGC3_9SPHN|nr:response regulator transcription factor [Alteraurantiacibacter aquimixticola]TIX51667.1 response regulator transcription factor [Alteraurantiacibacter aquimixticola]